METITRAAIVVSYNNIELTISAAQPARHPDIMDAAAEVISPLKIVAQGFITSTNRFVDRIEAATIANAAHQVITPTKVVELYTEDLW